MEIDRFLLRRFATSVAGLLCFVPASHAAGISFVNIFKNISYTQTGDGNTLTSNGAFFSAGLTSDAPGDYGTVTLDYPGPDSPVSLSQNSPTFFGFQTPTLASQGAMDAAFPFGTYTFTADGADVATLEYSGDDYGQTLPFLAGSTYSSLQGLDPSQAFTFHFSTDTPGGGPDETNAFIFFTIFDNTLNQNVFDGGFLSSSTTSLNLPANTLQFGHSYSYELDFSDRDTSLGTGSTFAPEIGFELRTDGTFSTEAETPAVPEPASMILSGFGLLGLGLRLCRKHHV